MFGVIQNTVLQLIPGRRKQTTSGWISFNAPCCHHRGHKPDSRGRGGIITNSDGSISYHCFNCQFKTGFKPGQYLGYKFRRLLIWLGADENIINRLILEAARSREYVGINDSELETVTIEFRARSLPDPVMMVDTDSTALEYCQQRHIDLNKYPMLVTNRIEHNLNRRVIVPFTWNNQLIGYTARAWDSALKPKYYSQYESNYVFNIDRQPRDGKFVIVCEGVFDALSIDGVAVLSNNCSEMQADIIDSLNREVILVPDNDHAGQQLIENALEFGWSVSFPIWFETCKDINEAVVHYGKLFVLKSILLARETSRLKIKLLKKRWSN